MAITEAQKRYRNKKPARRLVIDVCKNTEQDLLDWLDQQPRYATYIKDLIRADMAKRKGKQDGKKDN